jgi:4-diphosphocytidyl-2-C-methyl-D-erythritol kinase
MLCFPNCKINIGLYITARRQDGYHDLETVFYPVSFLTDVLEIVPAAVTQLYTSGIAIAGENEQNLVAKAYRLLLALFPEKVPAFDIFLHKAIPMGAGLGGGSADGAFLLQLLNNVCSLHLTDSELIHLALQLGSDCPFFVVNTPHFATGRGEALQPIPLDLSAYSLQIITPDIHVSTATAFRNCLPRPADFDLRQLPQLPVSEWKHAVWNDFETTVFTAHPQLAAIKQMLYSQGAIYASMSGSGSALYGIFPKGQRAALQDIGVHCQSFYGQ